MPPSTAALRACNPRSADSGLSYRLACEMRSRVGHIRVLAASFSSRCVVVCCFTSLNALELFCPFGLHALRARALNRPWRYAECLTSSRGPRTRPRRMPTAALPTSPTRLPRRSPKPTPRRILQRKKVLMHAHLLPLSPTRPSPSHSANDYTCHGKKSVQGGK